MYVFNLTSSNKIIGFQVRALDDNGGPKYKTWNIERIYDRLKKPLNVNEEELSLLDKLKLSYHDRYLDFLITVNADMLTHAGTNTGFEGADEATKYYQRNLNN